MFKRVVQNAILCFFNVLNRFIVIRFGIVNERALGHLIVDTEINYFRKKNFDNRNWDVWVSTGNTVNKTLSDFWKKFLPIRANLFALKTYHVLSKDERFKVNVINSEIDPGSGRELDENTSIFKFNQENLAKAQQDFESLQLNTNRKTILLCIRDSSYYLKNAKGTLEQLHSHRNVDAIAYQQGVQLLLDKGFQVVRMGRDAAIPLKIQKNGFVDLPFDSRVSVDNIGLSRREHLELFLAQNCYFAISSGLGSDSLATLFRKRVYFCDYFSTFHLYSSKLFPLFLPKGYVEKKTGRFLSPKEVFESAFFKFKFAYEFEEEGIRLENCNALQISQFFSSILEFELTGEIKYTSSSNQISEMHKTALEMSGKNFYVVPTISPLWSNLQVQ
jgi:putative glycosyltransferase (TIGR04372 family)